MKFDLKLLNKDVTQLNVDKFISFTLKKPFSNENNDKIYFMFETVDGYYEFELISIKQFENRLINWLEIYDVKIDYCVLDQIENVINKIKNNFNI